MVTERAVVRVFLYCHDLDRVVSVLFHPGEDVLPEFVIGTHFLFGSRHPHVRLIYKKGRCIRRETGMLKGISILRFPYLSTKNQCFAVLYNASAPRGDSFTPSAFPGDMEFVQILVMDPVKRCFYFPHPVIFSFKTVSL